jgi:hypothetical protein
MSQPQQTKNYGWIIASGIGVVLVGLIVWGVLLSKQSKKVITSEDVATLAGIQSGDAPWIAETDNLKSRLRAIGLPALSQEGSALHTHQHLDIFIDGKPISVPPGIGTNQSMGFIASIHTHESDNIVHVESPTIQTFTLGQFFDIWGVKFTDDSIGGYTNKDAKKLRVFVNGVEVASNLRNVELKAHQEIVVAYGTDNELPNPVPKAYDFPAGE